MTEQFNFFWWDGGFEAVHNRRDVSLNPLGMAHVLTPYYRIDISRFLAVPCGLEINWRKTDELKYGSVVPQAAIKIISNIEVFIDGEKYSLVPEPNENRCIMVYDSGTICHHLRIKNISLVDKNGILLPNIELEMVFFLWNDLISFSIHLLNAHNRLPVQDRIIKMDLNFKFEGCKINSECGDIYLSEENGKLCVCPVLNTKAVIEGDSIAATVDGNILCLHILPVLNTDTILAYKAFLTGQVKGEAENLINGDYLITEVDAISAGMIMHFPQSETNNSEKIKISVKTNCDVQIPIRMLVCKEGLPQIRKDGTIIPATSLKGFMPIGTYPMAYSLDKSPSGSLWQVSVDSHEFENYPRPYTHKWLHLYSQSYCSQNEPFDEILEIGFYEYNGRPAAQFCQLSLLGWDDNPYYGNPIDKTAVQLWHQGLINHQEILCMCPESHMTDSVITDIRPIDQRNFWGPNNGGGDFLRYRAIGKDYYNKMRASRCHFPNYGPNIGTVEYFMTSEDDCIAGHIKSHIIASNDIARVFFEAEYKVLKDCDVEEMTLIYLGCPGYDKSRYSRYAWGKQDVVMQDDLVEILKGPGYEIIEDPLIGGEWFAAYRGGIIDEQFREPNGNKGLVYRGGKVMVSSHPEAIIKAKRLRIDSFDGLTTQFWLGVYGDTDRITLKKGDMITVAWEYVPVLKYVTDYALKDDYSEPYKNILQNYPDSFQMIMYEAKHGLWKVKSIKGECVEDALFPTVKPVNGEAIFLISGGSGCTPLRIILENKPRNIRLEKMINYNWKNVKEIFKNGLYQLEKNGNKYVATFLLEGTAETLIDEKTQGEYRIILEE